MPFTRVETEPEVFIEWEGTVVYHTYEDDDFDEGSDSTVYSLDARNTDCGENGDWELPKEEWERYNFGSLFNVTEFPFYEECPSKPEPGLESMEAYEVWDSTHGREAWTAAMIIAALDEDLIYNPQKETR